MAGFTGDDRGVSEVLGAILVFGLVIALIALIQLHAVPAANANVEANHYDQVQEDLGRLQGALSRTGTGSSGEVVQVALGTRYPSRFILVNPPPVSGSIRTGQARSLTLENVTAVDEETADFLNTGGGPLSFDTRTLRYTPEYNQLSDPGTTVFETGVRYKQFKGGQSIQEKGVLVDGRTLTLLTIDGNLSETAASSATISTVPLSSSRAPVGIEEEGGPLRIHVPTNLSEKVWREELLDEEFDSSGMASPGKFVRGIDCADDSIAVDDPCDDAMILTMESGEIYNLRMARVGVGSGYTDPSPTYITDVQGDNTTVPENTTRKLTVQVRDRFNNPVSGVTLDAEVTDPAASESLPPPSQTVTTGSDGSADILYNAPVVNGDQTANVQVAFGSTPYPATNQTVSTLTVMDTDNSGSNYYEEFCDDAPPLGGLASLCLLGG